MKLIRYSHPIQNLREWEALLGDPFRVFAPFAPTSFDTVRGERAVRHPSPAVEWFEADTHYHARVELPGVKREHLRLDFEEGLLRLNHELVVGGEGGSMNRSRSEFVLRCPEGVRSEGIEARLADGILHLSFPKAEVRKPVAISIQ